MQCSGTQRRTPEPKGKSSVRSRFQIPGGHFSSGRFLCVGSDGRGSRLVGLSRVTTPTTMLQRPLFALALIIREHSAQHCFSDPTFGPSSDSRCPYKALKPDFRTLEGRPIYEFFNFCGCFGTLITLAESPPELPERRSREVADVGRVASIDIMNISQHCS